MIAFRVFISLYNKERTKGKIEKKSNGFRGVKFKQKCFKIIKIKFKTFKKKYLQKYYNVEIHRWRSYGRKRVKQ